MNISRTDFDWAVEQGLITREQAEALWAGLEARRHGQSEIAAEHKPAFNATNVLYYAGALIVITAMGCLMGMGWESFGGGGILIIALLYAAVFYRAGFHLWFRKNLRIPGGLLCTMAVSMTPLAIYGLERLTGFWPQSDPGDYHDFYPLVRGGWILMETGTVIAALVTLRFVRFPFLTAPLAFALWFMSMDVVPLLIGEDRFDGDARWWVSLMFGLVMLTVSFLVDRRTRDDYAFWGYLYGLLAFSAGLEVVGSHGEAGRVVVCLVNIALILTSVLLERPVFIVFGGIGVFIYLGHLAHDLFEYSILFPFVLSALGILIIYIGLLYQRHRQRIGRAIQLAIPEKIREMLPAHRK